MKTHKTTRIMTIAAFLAIVTAGAPLWAQDKAGDWRAWEGKANADKKEWDEMGEWYKSAAYLNDSAMQDMIKQMKEFAGRNGDQKGGVKFWKKNKAAYQKALAAAQKELEKVRAVTAADFTVKVTSDGSSVTLQNYKGSAPNIIVPAELEGLPVKWVDFEGNKTIRSVTIADGVGLTEGCFANCIVLKSVTLPKGITKIEKEMFKGCTSLASLTIPDSVTAIGASAFSGSGIKEMVIPDSVTKIENYAFSKSGIKEMVIPDSVTSIGDSLFSGSAIERVTLPKGFRMITDSMFRSCTNLKSITLPADLVVIRAFAFCGSGLQSIVFPDSVTEIGKQAFADCKNLTEVTLPKNLKELGDSDFEDLGSNSQFRGCSSLKRIVISANVRVIYHWVFKDCAALEEITFEGNTEISESRYHNMYYYLSVFDGCKNIKKLNAGPGVTKIKGVENIPGPNVEGLPLKEQAELKAAWTAFMAKYGD